MDNSFFNNMLPFLTTEDGLTELYIKGQISKEEYIRRMDEFRDWNKE